MYDGYKVISIKQSFLSQIEKTFSNLKRFEIQGKVSQKKFENEISSFAKKIEFLKKKSKNNFLFMAN